MTILSENQNEQPEASPWSYQAIKTCPKCHSPFIDQFCDSCGYKQTAKNSFATDNGEDFYQLKSQYVDARPLWILIFPFLEKLQQKRINIFLFKIKRRVKTLLEMMMRADFQEGSNTFKTLYQLELTNALDEIAYYQKNIKSLRSYPEKIYQELKAKQIAVDSFSYATLRESISHYQIKATLHSWQTLINLVEKNWRELKLIFICGGSLAILMAMALYTFKLFN